MPHSMIPCSIHHPFFPVCCADSKAERARHSNLRHDAVTVACGAQSTTLIYQDPHWSMTAIHSYVQNLPWMANWLELNRTRNLLTQSRYKTHQIRHLTAKKLLREHEMANRSTELTKSTPWDCSAQRPIATTSKSDFRMLETPWRENILDQLDAEIW
jgi:hypothetical protein